MADADNDNDNDNPFSTDIDPTTASMSKGMAAVDAVLRFGRQNAGLGSHGISRFGGPGAPGSQRGMAVSFGGGDDGWKNWGNEGESASNSGGGGGGNGGGNSNVVNAGSSDDDSSSSDDSGDDSGGDYAGGGLVRDYADGGETSADDSDSYDDSAGQQDDPFNAGVAEAPQQTRAIEAPQQQDQPETFGDQNNTPWYAQDNGMLPINMAMAGGRAVGRGVDAVMSYLHGSDGAPKEAVDAAMAAASGDSTDKVLADHEAEGNKREDHPSIDPYSKKPILPTPSAIQKAAQSNEQGDKGDEPSAQGYMPKDQAGAANAAQGEDNKLDSTAAKAVAKAHEEGGPEQGWSLMQGMRKIYNALFGQAGAAATGSPDKPPDLNAAVNHFNMGSEYLPGPEEMRAIANERGGVTVTVKDAGKVTKHDLTPQEFAAAVNPGTGMQFDKVLHKGPTPVINDVKSQQAQQQQGNPLGIPASAQPPQPPQQQPQQQQQQQPARTGAEPDYVTDDKGVRHNRNPNAVTIFGGRHGPTNGWGEQVRSDDPRSVVNRDARQAREIAETKDEGQTKRAQIAYQGKTDSAKINADQRAASGEAKNKTTERGQDKRAQSAADMLAMQKSHFDQLNNFRGDHEVGMMARDLIKANPNISAEDAVKAAETALAGQRARRNQNPTQVQGAPKGPQAQAPQAPQVGSDPISKAKAAIAKGANRDQVIERLKQAGINPAGL